MVLKYISLFSGMEAATAAFAMAGIDAEPVAFAEIDPAASAVLGHRWPRVPNYGDITKHDWKSYRGQVDIVLGGSPCQTFSVAGKRLGLDDPRGNLALHYLRVVRDIRPRWFVYENVPGLMSSGGGEDFSAFLETVENLGYHGSWRVLDAKHFGVPQRRRRIFFVGHLGADWRPSANVLFEPPGKGRNIDASRTPRKNVAAGPVGSTEKLGLFQHTGFAKYLEDDTTSTVTAHLAHMGHDLVVPQPVVATSVLGHTHTHTAEGCDASEDGTGHGTPVVAIQQPMVFDQRGNGDGNLSPTLLRESLHHPTDFGPCVVAGTDTGSTSSIVVRRLTPLECLRLQGFPDDWLDRVLFRGKPLADTHKYKMIGNSWAVPCAAWILARLVQVDRKLHRRPPTIRDDRRQFTIFEVL